MRKGAPARRSAWLFVVFAAYASGAVLRVGPNHEYATSCEAINSAKTGDRIEIDAAGTYRGDVCAWITNDLTLVGVNGRPRIEAAGQSAQDRAIWVISGANTTIDNIEFTGTAVPSHNGAGILQKGTNLTVRNCYFHHNEEGILAGSDPASTILVENTEFAENG